MGSGFCAAAWHLLPGLVVSCSRAAARVATCAGAHPAGASCAMSPICGGALVVQHVRPGQATGAISGLKSVFEDVCSASLTNSPNWGAVGVRFPAVFSGCIARWRLAQFC